MMRKTYEADDETFDAAVYEVDSGRGIAWDVLGWETAEDSDTEWSGIRPPGPGRSSQS
jgi:hypothetical protein